MLSAARALFLLLISVVDCSLPGSNFVVKEVVVKPGGVARSVSIEGVSFLVLFAKIVQFGVECRFDYTCQGGTGEVSISTY